MSADRIFGTIISCSTSRQSRFSPSPDDIAERVRKVGGTTLRSIGSITRLQRVPDNDADYVDPLDMLAELRSDNQALIASMREAHDLCEEEGDVATTSLIEVWIDQAERRVWFLYEASRRGDPRH
jgi:starvation-inducible DNA-binding protein